jgi:Protein of unknown function (DUF3631)
MTTIGTPSVNGHEPGIPGLDPQPDAPTQPDDRYARVAETVRAFLTRYVALGDHEADALALWVIHTHTFAACETTPYIAITSTGPGTGKTRCLEALELLVANPWATSRVTGPALVRKVGAEHPTLLLDETDALFTGHVQSQEVLRGVINAGYRLGGKTSYASGGGYVEYDVFCPKAFAGIGDLPRTIADRSIPIVMRKRTAFTPVERLRRRDVKAEARVPRMLAARFAAVHLEPLRRARPDIPTALDDRAADVWEPLLAIADCLGADWPARARAAAVSLCAGRKEADTESVAFDLLADCRAVFTELDADRLQTVTLLEWLIDTGRWSDMGGVQLDARSLSDTLRGFGVSPRKIRFGRITAQGYLRREFEGAWALVGSDVPDVLDVPDEEVDA